MNIVNYKPKKETFLITRPTLASRLMGAGAVGEVVAHPFEKDRKAWVFRATREAVALAREYYASVGSPLPNSLKPENIGEGI